MKILHIISGLTLSYKGGVSTYVRSLAQIQKEHGYHVHIYGSKDEESPYPFFECKTSKYRSFSKGIMLDSQLLEELEGYLEQERFDIIHIHSAFLLPWNVWEILKKYRYIISLHDYYYLCARGAVMVDNNGCVCSSLDLQHCRTCISSIDQWIEKRWLLRKAVGFSRRILGYDVQKKLPRIQQTITDARFYSMKNLLEYAKLLLPVSHRTESIYRMAGISNRYRVVHIGNNSALRYEDEYILSPVQEDGFLHVAMIGEMSYMKGADLFLKMVASCRRRDMMFHFWGKCSHEYKTALGRNHIKNHGMYEHSMLSDILKGIDIAIVPPLCEDAGPQVIMELLNNHVPILATNRGGIPDFVSRENGFLFHPNEVEKAIEFLSQLSANRINKMKKHIKRTKTPEEHFLEMDYLYRDVLEKEM